MAKYKNKINTKFSTKTTKNEGGIQAFYGNGKRGYLYSLRAETTETQAAEGLDSGLYGRAYGHRQIAHIKPGKRQERSRIARSGNTCRQLRHVTAATLEQNLNSTPLALRSDSQTQRVGCNHVAQDHLVGRRFRQREPHLEARFSRL